MSKAELFIPRQEILGPREACGITAIYSKTEDEYVSTMIPGLQKQLQHRGRDSTGIAVLANGQIRNYVKLGEVSEVFPDDFNFSGHGLLGKMAIGHNRYGTSGGNKKDDESGAQPAVAEWKGKKIAISYNGNVPDSIREQLKSRIPLQMRNSVFDTQDIANAIVCAQGDNWEERIRNAMFDIKGAYSLTILTDDGRVFGLRGPSGTWPLWYGETENKIIIASETRVYQEENIQWYKVEPGELIEATPNGIKRKRIFAREPSFPCSLHDIYGAQQDSLMAENMPYAELRRELGRELAREHPVEADVIAGVPNTGLVIAEGYAEELGRKPTILIEKNGKNPESQRRSFIAKTIGETAEIVSRKFWISDKNLASDKSVLLIDDSLIRGKTMGGDPKQGLKGVVGFVRDAGAKEVHLAVVLPKFVNGCDMGYYIRQDQLVAVVKDENGNYKELSEQDIASIIGADSVYFLSMSGLAKAYKKTLGTKTFCTACMGGNHPITGNLEEERRDKTTVYSA